MPPRRIVPTPIAAEPYGGGFGGAFGFFGGAAMEAVPTPSANVACTSAGAAAGGAAETAGAAAAPSGAAQATAEPASAAATGVAAPPKRSCLGAPRRLRAGPVPQDSSDCFVVNYRKVGTRGMYSGWPAMLIWTAWVWRGPGGWHACGCVGGGFFEVRRWQMLQRRTSEGAEVRSRWHGRIQEGHHGAG
eukprot:359749-Chlamydomonas_euryale.AAC.5